MPSVELGGASGGRVALGPRSSPIKIFLDPGVLLGEIGGDELHRQSRLALLGLHKEYPDAHISGVELAEALDELDARRAQDEEDWFVSLRQTADGIAEELHITAEVEVVRDWCGGDSFEMVTTRLERDVEQALMDRLQDTLMEFGRGMALVGRQFRLPMGDGARHP